MIKIKKTHIIGKLKAHVAGFVLPLTLVICVIILTIATGISIILTKELYFSKLSRLSQVAYYAADNGLMCATMVDDQYIDPTTGLGIFQYADTPTSQTVLDGINAQRTAQGLSSLSLNSIKCATSAVFEESVSGFSVLPFSRIDSGGNVDNGKTTTFNMRMDIGNSEYRCATVVINKTVSYRQIISRGFASCSTVYAYPIERAIVSTSETSGGAATFSAVGETTYSTPGSYMWTAPPGVTSVSVVCVGSGGNGQSSSSGYGGGGGALSYANNIVVASGNTYAVVVAAAGDENYSSFNSTTVRAGSGKNIGTPGTVTYGTGGSGGSGRAGAWSGGGGAGGYSGAGGNGGYGYSTPPTSGTGGASSGGGSMFINNAGGGGGGGVGLFGQGSNGVPGAGLWGGTMYGSAGAAGGGGSSGSDGSVGKSATNGGDGGNGGMYGGGGGSGMYSQSTETFSLAGVGAGGACRIIWPGNERSFPSTRTATE